MWLPKENILRHGCKLTWSISKILLWDELARSCVVLPQDKANESLSLWNLCFRDQVTWDFVWSTWSWTLWWNKTKIETHISFSNWGRSSCVAKQGGRSLRHWNFWNLLHLWRNVLPDSWVSAWSKRIRWELDTSRLMWLENQLPVGSFECQTVGFTLLSKSVKA